MVKVFLILMGMMTGLMAKEEGMNKKPVQTPPYSTNLRPTFPDKGDKNNPLGSIKAINPVQTSKTTCWRAQGDRWLCRRTIYW